MNINERILEILCNRCSVKNYSNCKECKEDGDYKEVENLINAFESDIIDDFEYRIWEESLGDDL